MSPSAAAPAQPALDAATLFVRGLSAGTTHAALEAHFSGAAPLRHAFVCTTGGEGEGGGAARCRGFGFVQFTNAEDARRAERLLHGSVLDGRKVRVEFARRRMRAGGREGKDGKDGKDGKEAKMAREAGGERDPDGGMAVRKRPREAGEGRGGGEGKGKRPRVEGALKGSLAMRTVLVRPARGEGGRPVSEAAVARRARAVEGGGGFVETVMVGGGEVRAVYESWPQAGKAARLMHGEGWEAVVEGVRGKRCRVIVRNLPFEVVVAQLRAAVEACGDVRELHVVRPGEGRGVDKWGKGKQQEEEGVVRTAGYAFVEYFLPAAANHAVAKLNGTKLGGRVVAVDLAVAKGKYEARVGEEEEERRGGGEGEEEVAEGEGREDVADEEEEDEAPARVKKEGKSTSEEMARTVFVRNLLFETSSAELRGAMQMFGDVEQAVLVVDPHSGRPRGTAFVRFRDEASADKAAAASGGTGAAARAAAADDGVVVGGRPLLVSKAVDRSKARALVEEGAGKGGKKPDPRNLRLAWVGAVKAGTPEATGLSPEDLKKRANAEKEKKAKLSHNPNAFVSEVRLSVRNLPREVDEKTLKHMCIDAAAGADGAAAKGRAAFSAPKVVHVKILRDAERNGRSKGYGFVQFERHEHAMAALEKLNNNPKAMEALIRHAPKALAIDDARARRLRKDWGDGRRLLVEFAVEDRRQVRIIEQVKSRGREKAAAIASKREDESKDASRMQEVQRDGNGSKKKQNVVARASAKPTGKSAKRSVHKMSKLVEEDKGEDVENAPESSLSAPRSKWKALQADSKIKKSPAATDRAGAIGAKNIAGKAKSKQDAELRVAKPLQKPRRQAKRESREEKVDAKEKKFDSLVSAYKKKVASSLAPVSSGPRWFD